MERRGDMKKEGGRNREGVEREKRREGERKGEKEEREKCFKGMCVYLLSVHFYALLCCGTK